MATPKKSIAFFPLDGEEVFLRSLKPNKLKTSVALSLAIFDRLSTVSKRYAVPRSAIMERALEIYLDALEETPS